MGHDARQVPAFRFQHKGMGCSTNLVGPCLLEILTFKEQFCTNDFINILGGQNRCSMNIGLNALGSLTDISNGGDVIHNIRSIKALSTINLVGHSKINLL